MKRVLRWTGLVLIVLAVGGAIAYAMRTNPIGPIAGRQLTGELVTEPVADWSFSDEHMTIAVESRPAAPHSVTVICFTHEGALYVPAQAGSTKSWTHYALADPRMRVKIADKVYPVRATRVMDTSMTDDLTAAAAAKYDFGGEDGDPSLEDVWVFRLDSASADVAGGPPPGFTLSPPAR